MSTAPPPLPEPDPDDEPCGEGGDRDGRRWRRWRSLSWRRRLASAFVAVAVTSGLVFLALLVPSTHGFTVVTGAGVIGLAVISVGLWGRTRRPDTYLCAVSDVSIDIGVALVTGAVLGWVLFPVEEDRFAREQVIEEARNERASRSDNIRFVREVATEADAPNKPFSSLDLREAELSGLKLEASDFTGADLTRADFTDAHLGAADLERADLDGARLRDANLVEANLPRTALVGADLSRANLTRAVIAGADLTGTDLSQARLAGANLGNADLVDADLSHANLEGAVLVGADLTGADLTGAKLDGAYLVYADLTGATTTDVQLDATTFWPIAFGPPPR